MDPKDLVAKSLHELGNTAEEVAVVLKHKKIQGIRNTVRMLNPVVRYVKPLVPDTRDIDIIQRGTLRITLRNGLIDRVTLPQAVQAFLDAFNSSDYPELEIPAGQQ
jgi:hypothetical protein